MMLWSSEFWQTVKRIAEQHGFIVVPGNHKDHYRLSRGSTMAKFACREAMRMAGVPFEERWLD